ncbi:MAG: hypothetical protein IT258_16670 [Saprospiraceae bacterium]|nr:hypothetical protein [Saprospiraceae bacterium]
MQAKAIFTLLLVFIATFWAHGQKEELRFYKLEDGLRFKFVIMFETHEFSLKAMANKPGFKTFHIYPKPIKQLPVFR